jgi:membrane protein implicated in regulation of membrane protease activity
MFIYIVIAGVGLVLLLVMLLVGEVFGDHDVSHDVGGHIDSDVGGPSVLSLRIMASFLTAFGVGGVVGRYYGLSHPVSSGIGLVAGVVLAGIVYQFAKLLYAQQASSEIRMTGLVGATAEVSVAIPANGVGQVVLSYAGERSEHIARAADGRALPRGVMVRITNVGGDSVTVAPVESAAGGGAR